MKEEVSPFRFDVAVVGGGLSGLCAAVAAARHGAKTAIIQDRSMFGGNASSEIRMWVCGALGENCKETGLLEELQLDNLYRNPMLKYSLWDGVMYDFARSEKNLSIFLNTAIDGCTADDGRITEITGRNLIEYQRYRFAAEIFIDCSGDGILRLSGAAARRGRESRAEFGESLAEETADDHTQGSSIIMQLRKTSLPHREFRPPEWAYRFTDETVPKRNLMPEGNNFWWLDFGGIMDTLGDGSQIRDELLKIAYGIWAYIKNHPDGRGHAWELDWIGSLPGRRESWRFEGEHILTQHDIESGGNFPDIVAHGGWGLGCHCPEGFFDRESPGVGHPAPSPFGIPLRALYSRNIRNLFFAGRQISVTHVAQNATRVMGTCAVMGQAAGTAAALAARYGIAADEVRTRHLEELQELLLDDDQFLPGFRREPSPLARQGIPSSPFLRDGMDRDWRDGIHAVALMPGEGGGFRFPEPVPLRGARIVFDSDLNDPKRQLCVAEEKFREMPPMLCRDFRIRVHTGTGWVTVAEERDNHHRLRKIFWPEVRGDELQLIPVRSWGEGASRVFALDPL